MIGVIGAGGDLGRIVLEDLLTKVPADEIRAVVADPSPVEPYRSSRNIDIRLADPDDPASLQVALAGVETLLVIPALLFIPALRPAPEVRLRRRGAVVDAAVAAGVGRLVDVRAHDDFDHASWDLPVTVLRATLPAETLVNAGLSQVVADGVLRGADGGRPVNWVGIVDIALAVSEAVTGDGHVGRVHEIRGALWTLPGLAAVLAEVSGRSVVHREVPASELGPDAPLHRQIAGGLFAEPGDDLGVLLERPPTALRSLVVDALAGRAVWGVD